MKKIFILIVTALLSMNVMAQDCCSDAATGKKCCGKCAVYTKQFGDAKLVKKAAKWAKQGKWKNGFTKAEPDNMVNLTEFYLQYTKNPEVWKQLFKWLQDTDLLAIPAGKHKIEGSPLTASVEDSYNEDVSKRKSESHRKNIDFMFVVKGTEGFLRLDHKTSKENTEYKPDVVRYAYDINKAEFIESTPGRFLIFFPDDWHVAKVLTKKDDQNLRVIVVKMPVAE